jgi:hypothetical protein
VGLIVDVHIRLILLPTSIELILLPKLLLAELVSLRAFAAELLIAISSALELIVRLTRLELLIAALSVRRLLIARVERTVLVLLELLSRIAAARGILVTIGIRTRRRRSVRAIESNFIIVFIIAVTARRSRIAWRARLVPGRIGLPIVRIVVIIIVIVGIIVGVGIRVALRLFLAAGSSLGRSGRFRLAAASLPKQLAR